MPAQPGWMSAHAADMPWRHFQMMQARLRPTACRRRLPAYAPLQLAAGPAAQRYRAKKSLASLAGCETLSGQRAPLPASQHMSASLQEVVRALAGEKFA